MRFGLLHATEEKVASDVDAFYADHLVLFRVDVIDALPMLASIDLAFNLYDNRTCMVRLEKDTRRGSCGDFAVTF